ncbi:MAG: hypothetical protein VXZ05_04910, partial [Pseudomonadota bacterium]|nr:hypothetical protein [Pseudomonadota bacterium]
MKRDTELQPLRIRRNRYALLANCAVPLLIMALMLFAYSPLDQLIADLHETSAVGSAAILGVVTFVLVHLNRIWVKWFVAKMTGDVAPSQESKFDEAEPVMVLSDAEKQMLSDLRDVLISFSPVAALFNAHLTKTNEVTEE